MANLAYPRKGMEKDKEKWRKLGHLTSTASGSKRSVLLAHRKHCCRDPLAMFKASRTACSGACPVRKQTLRR